MTQPIARCALVALALLATAAVARADGVHVEGLVVREGAAIARTLIHLDRPQRDTRPHARLSVRALGGGRIHVVLSNHVEHCGHPNLEVDAATEDYDRCLASNTGECHHSVSLAVRLPAVPPRPPAPHEGIRDRWPRSCVYELRFDVAGIAPGTWIVSADSGTSVLAHVR